MADAGQFRKVKSIIEADPARKVIVVSAAGKRFKDDHKLTDLLYLCHAHKKYGVSCDPVFDMIADRYREICAELGLSVDIDSELSALREEIGRAANIFRQSSWPISSATTFSTRSFGCIFPSTAPSTRSAPTRILSALPSAAG